VGPWDGLIDGDGVGRDAPEGHAPVPALGELLVPLDPVARGVGVGLPLPDGMGL
jgi:hypothetical protein